jgi:hypothetical protein
MSDQDYSLSGCLFSLSRVHRRVIMPDFPENAAGKGVKRDIRHLYGACRDRTVRGPSRLCNPVRFLARTLVDRIRGQYNLS